MVVHVAGFAHQFGRMNYLQRSQFHDVNVLDKRAVVQACGDLRIARIVVLSSIAVYGSACHGTINEETGCELDSDYGWSKILAEEVMRSVLKDALTDWCIVRLPAVYEPGDRGNVAKLAQPVIGGWPLPFGSIRNRRSFAYVGNFVDTLTKIVAYPGCINLTFLVSDGEAFSTPGLVRALALSRGLRVGLFRCPIPALRIVCDVSLAISHALRLDMGIDAKLVEGLTDTLVVDGSRFMQFFDWTSPTNPLEAVKISHGTGEV